MSDLTFGAGIWEKKNTKRETHCAPREVTENAVRDNVLNRSVVPWHARKKGL